MNDSLPLAGITVLAIEQAIAAPLCTRQLAELGARVIKVERPGSGDFARHYDERVNGLSSHFVWTNRGKESLTLNLKHASAQQILARMLPTVDVLVQNLAPSACQRLGLAFAQLHDSHPGLICCDISGYGEAGPYANKKAYDLLVQAEAGFLSVSGLPNQMVKSGISIADIAAGMQAHAAILAALIQRGRSGIGSKISISLLEAMTEWMGFPLYYAYQGQEPPPRAGADHASIYPYGVFSSGDQQALMLGLQNEREWQRFCELVLEDASVAADGRFINNKLRSENREALHEIIRQCFASQTAAQIKQRLDQAAIAYGDVNDMASLWQHPQLRALDRLVEFDSPVGRLKGFKPPGNNSQYEAAIGSVPALGEHTAAILQELEFSEGDIAGFTESGVV